MTPDASRPLAPAIWALLGMGGALIGLLPWLIAGARLPLQSLSAADAGGDVQKPISLLPLHQYFLTTIVALLVVGAAVSGIFARALTSRRPRFGTLALAGGTVLVQVVAAVQALVATAGVIEDSDRARIYLTVMAAVVLVSMLIALLVLLLVAKAPVPGATVALSLAALTSAAWLGAAFRDLMLLGPAEVSSLLLPVLTWMPAVFVGCAIAFCGFATPGRIGAVAVSLVALWIGPAFFTAVSAAAGTRVLAAYPAEMAEYGVQVFLMAAAQPEIVLRNVAVALVVGLVGRALTRAVQSRRIHRRREVYA